MTTTPDIISLTTVATATSSAVQATGGFDFLKELVFPLVVGIILLLLERFFDISKAFIKQGPAEQRFKQKIKNWSWSMIIGSHNTVNINNNQGFLLNGEGNAPNPLGPPDSPRPLPLSNILQPKQVAICDAVKKVSQEHTFKPFDPRADYETAQKHLNGGDISLAATFFYRIFSNMAAIFTNIVSVNQSAGQQITDLQTVTAGLEAMLSNPAAEQNEIKRQIGNCEVAAQNIIGHLPS